jgi:MFS transporter
MVTNPGTVRISTYASSGSGGFGSRNTGKARPRISSASTVAVNIRDAVRVMPAVTRFINSAGVSTRGDSSPPRLRLRSRLASQVSEGFRFLWGQPFLRTCALLFALANFLGPGLLFALVVIGTGQGLSGGEIGALVAAFGACLLLGSVASPLVRRIMPVRAVLLLELWTWPACVIFLAWPSVYVLTGAVLLTALAIPSTDSVVHGYRIAMTPDRLLGRADSVRSTISLLIAPLGPLAAGILLANVSPRATIAVFAAAGLVLAIWGTLSPSIRAAPSLDRLGGAAHERA